MSLSITSFDGFQFGKFEETDKNKTDTYSTRIIPRWYGSVIEQSNDRTEFVIWRDMDFNTLREAVYTRIQGLGMFDDFNRRELIRKEDEFQRHLHPGERSTMNSVIAGGIPADIAGNHLQMSGVNELAVITIIDRYAYRAPPEVKLAAGVEYAVWLIRQPAASNRVNALVRSGAATMLDAYKHRGL